MPVAIDSLTAELKQDIKLKQNTDPGIDMFSAGIGSVSGVASAYGAYWLAQKAMTSKPGVAVRNFVHNFGDVSINKAKKIFQSQKIV